MASGPSFILDNEAKYYTIAPGNIITGNHLEYLLACLNSDIFYFALRKYYMGGVIEGELKTNRLLILPVPIPNESIEKKICYILRNNCIDNRECQKEIDEELCSILHLNEEEYSYIVNQHIS